MPCPVPVQVVFTGAPLHFFTVQLPISPVAVHAAKLEHVPPVAGQVPPGQFAALVQTRLALAPPEHNRQSASLSQWCPAWLLPPTHTPLTLVSKVVKFFGGF